MGMRHAAVVAGLALGLMSGSAKAAFLYSITQSASGVSIVGSGSINLAGETSEGTLGSGTVGVIPNSPLIYTGDESGPGVDVYTADFTAIPAFGSGTSSGASSGTGALFGFGEYNLGTAYDLFVPEGYTSGETIASTAFFGGATFGSLGITAGDYTYTLGNSDTVQIDISTVPLPASAPMFGAALVALGAVGYGLRRTGKAAAQ